MSASALPDFECTIQWGQDNLDTAGLAECHGVLCGLVGRKSGSTTQQWAHEDEVAFTEIVEYVRVVTLMMHEDYRGPGANDPIH